MTVRTNTPTEAGSWRLGGDLPVRRIGFGAMRLTGTEPFGGGVPRDREQSIAVLRKAVELGVNHIDTAAFYFSATRSANELINRALAPYPDGLVIATKVWPGRDTLGDWWWARPEQLRGQVEENLRQLGRDHLDLVNLRVPRSGRADSIGDHVGALAELRDAGLIRHLGVSNVTSDQLTEALAIAPVACVQNPYGIGAPAEDRALLARCGDLGIAFVPFYAIAGSGGEAGPPPEEAANIVAVARTHGVSVAQIKLAWTLHQGAHVLPIPGTGDPHHLEENLRAAEVRLTGQELALLDGSSAAPQG
ncbi:aldo/keto reductase [Streptomyces sp. Da 82-17]|uniref:aldo/keto reductase n=1 Tax=Streptomyces sp. Da 82-17 TaxID=3377116 RepID=UPI0038D3FCDE